MLNYPSDVQELLVEGAVDNRPFKWKIKIPKEEVFRIRDIFEGNDYPLPKFAYLDQITCVDIGANVGVFSLFLKSHYPNATIHAFEPVVNSFKLLEANLAGITSVNLYNCALSNFNGQADINIHGKNSGGHSLKTIKGPAIIGTEKVAVRHAHEQLSEIGVDLIDILKIDTEGSEVEIVRALLPMLGRVNNILLEYHTANDRTILMQLLSGFALYAHKEANVNTGILCFCSRSQG